MNNRKSLKLHKYLKTKTEINCNKIVQVKLFNGFIRRKIYLAVNLNRKKLRMQQHPSPTLVI